MLVVGAGMSSCRAQLLLSTIHTIVCPVQKAGESETLKPVPRTAQDRTEEEEFAVLSVGVPFVLWIHLLALPLPSPKLSSQLTNPVLSFNSWLTFLCSVNA